ncbi:DUF5050 domain-containing protein [Marinilactibacillus kalidii]|uniref:DUF5050 domain-containing protein n=1 Tax=Marinilactibacillus kalidii TaxID=2820274 RepID=UPI001ABEDF4C|nr:DUF5050 domain-containing protein [Marinilactibacillus kalidii]
MKRFKNWLDLIWRFCLVIYAPFFLIYYLLGIFDTYDFYSIQMLNMMVYIVGFILAFVSIYQTTQLKVDLKDVADLHTKLKMKHWRVVNEQPSRMILEPSFDRPFRWVIKSEVELIFIDGNATLKGPRIYVRTLKRQLKNQKVFWIRKPLTILRDSLLLIVLGMTLLFPSNLDWQALWSQRKILAEPLALTEVQAKQLGNTNENTHNNGYAVENDAFFFYVESNNKIVRTNHEFKEKETVISAPNNYGGLRDLNIIGEWLYYTKDSVLHRVQFDGTNKEVVYDSPDMLEMHIVGNESYFIMENNNRNLYKIDLNEGTLTKLMDTYVTDISIYEDSLFVSHPEGKDGEFVVDQLSLVDGKKQQTLFKEPANHLIRWEEDYYYLGSDTTLKKLSIDSSLSQTSLTEEQLDYFIPTENGIYYTYQLNPTVNARAALHHINVDGYENELLFEADSIQGLAQIGDSLLFTTVEDELSYTTRKIDLKTGEMEEMN